jgi:beta-xylosidase
MLVIVAEGARAQTLAPLFDYPVRDTCVCLGPDGTYYLTGTTGHPTWWNVNEGIRIWKSKDLKKWDALGLVWSIEKDSTWQKVKIDKDGKKTADSAIWAPELHYLKGTYWLTYSMNYGGTGILKSTTGKPEGPYADIKKDGPLTGDIDASLFADDDGSVYFVWQDGKVAKMKEDMSGLAETPRHVGRVGFEGAFITKINGRYHLISAEFTKHDDKTQTYDCMAAISASIYGPYSERYLVLQSGGHNMLFKDAQGQWWSTFFGNDVKAPFKERPAILKVEIGKDNRIKPVVGG